MVEHKMQSGFLSPTWGSQGVWGPEFLQSGSGFLSTCFRDRMVLGSQYLKSECIMKKLWKPVLAGQND